jgi:hypothetical protein
MCLSPASDSRESAGAPEKDILDVVAEAGWAELASTFELSEIALRDPLDAIKRAYLAMDSLMRDCPTRYGALPSTLDTAN